MFVQDSSQIAPLEAPDGSLVRELAGLSAGGLQTHSIAQITLPPGTVSLKHYHPTVEESYYILSGTARVVIDDETLYLSPGQVIAIVPQQAHQICNDSTHEDVVFIAVCAPPWTPDCSVFLD